MKAGKNILNDFVDRAVSRIARSQSRLKRSWARIQFDRSINQNTIKNHGKILAEAERALKQKEVHESDDAYAVSGDLLIKQGHVLKEQTEKVFKDKYSGNSMERMMIHVPDPVYSPAGFSLLTNIAECFEFIGIPTHILGWNDDTNRAINQFNPTVMLSGDHASYLERIDWVAIRTYRAAHRLKIGLTASLAEYDNTPLNHRLSWAQQHGIDFFYSFRDAEYVSTRKEYTPFFDAGYKMLYLPFGANILHYYPVTGFDRDIDFVLIATRKREHQIFMEDVVKRYYGFIDGPGWKHASHFKFNKDRDRYIYARAKVGLNVHLPEQIDWACEVNERTYQLAACGVPQVIDHPKLLDKLFSKEALFIADTPKQYTAYVETIIKDPAIGQERALNAQKEVFENHTTFHRADSFIRQLRKLI